MNAYCWIGVALLASFPLAIFIGRFIRTGRGGDEFEEDRTHGC